MLESRCLVGSDVGCVLKRKSTPSGYFTKRKSASVGAAAGYFGGR